MHAYASATYTHERACVHKPHNRPTPISVYLHKAYGTLDNRTEFHFQIIVYYAKCITLCVRMCVYAHVCACAYLHVFVNLKIE